MFEKHADLQELFPPRQESEWRKAAEAGLGGRKLEERLVRETYEGLRLQPLYHAANAEIRRRALDSFPRHGELCQESDHPDPQAVALQLGEELERGVTGVQLRLDRALRRGDGPDTAGVAEDGVAIHHLSDLDRCLETVHDSTPVSLDAGVSAVAAAVTLLARSKGRGQASGGCLGLDPLGTLAAEGVLLSPAEVELERMADVARWCRQHAPDLRAVAVDTSAHHHAGAHEALDLGLLASTGLAYLRALDRSGIPPGEASTQLLFRVRMDPSFFLAIAKLRALRRIWARIMGQVDGDVAGLRIQARLSERALTRRDPWVNILRNTAAGFAAAIGGADVFTSEPFDRRLGLSREFSRRLARNTQILLEEESHLRRVVDPAGGSWFLETLTSELAREGWAQFQAIEGEGGVLAALRSGWLAQRIETTQAARTENLARRRDPITGVSEFAQLGERPPLPEEPDRERLRAAVKDREPVPVADLPEPGTGKWTNRLVQAVRAGAGLDDLNEALRAEPEIGEALPLRPFAQPFEELRDAADVHREEKGHEPEVFLATLGVLAEYNLRATWVSNLLRAGGLRPRVGGDAPDVETVRTAYGRSPSPVVVVCSTDDNYARLGAETARRLRREGARRVYLAGRPDEDESAFREAGVDEFLHLGCDVLSHLREMHEILEVRS